MTNLDRAHDLQRLLGEGKFDEALDTYYADDVVVVEANGDEFTGREVQRERVHQFMASIEEAHGGETLSVCGSTDDTTTTAHTTFDATYTGMGRSTLEEVAVQTWKDGKIVHEKFLYWVPAEAQQAMSGA